MSKIHILSKHNSLVNQFIAELRDLQIQKDRARFRNNLKRLGSIFAYEISKSLPFELKDVTTPLGVANVDLPTEFPVVISVLRAGLPLQEGLSEFFDKSDLGFVSAYRNPTNQEDEFNIEVEYCSVPDLEGKIVIIADTMLATGKSIKTVFKQLKQSGKPKKIHVVSVLASVEGIEYVQEQLPQNVDYWFAAVDDELTAQAFIVPGLGDAGDLAFGKKQ